MKLIAITDGALTRGQNKGVITLLQRHMEGLGIHHNVRKCQENIVCNKVSDVMDVAVKAVNVMSQGLNYHQFLATFCQNQSFSIKPCFTSATFTGSVEMLC